MPLRFGVLIGSLAASIVAVAALPEPAAAQVTVFTSTSSESFGCSLAARHGHATPDTLKSCTTAIDHEGLSGRELAGTYVNRGVLYLVQENFRAAEQDFDSAIGIDPDLGEAWINRGASKIAQRHWASGVADIDKGLPMKPEQPEKAYFNRALAKEYLEDMAGAYADYTMAVELAPTWDLPKDELKRFTLANKRSG